MVLIKKAISTGLILAIILCMTGCGEQKAITIAESQPTPEVSDEKDGEADAGESLSNESGVPKVTYLDVTFEEHYDNCYEDALLMNANYKSIKLQTTDYPALTEAVNTFNTE